MSSKINVTGGSYQVTTSADNVNYNNATSGLSATNAQGAIDELKSRVVYLTQAQYDALNPPLANVQYWITDGDSAGSVINDSLVSAQQTWSSNKIQQVTGKFLTETLTAGQTTVTFQDTLINANAMIDVYTSDGVWFTDMTFGTYTVTVTFPVQAADMTVRIHIKS